VNPEEGGCHGEQDPQTGGGSDEAVPLDEPAPPQPPGTCFDRRSVLAAAAAGEGEGEAQPVDVGAEVAEQGGERLIAESNTIPIAAMVTRAAPRMKDRPIPNRPSLPKGFAGGSRRVLLPRPRNGKRRGPAL